MTCSSDTQVLYTTIAMIIGFSWLTAVISLTYNDIIKNLKENEHE